VFQSQAIDDCGEVAAQTGGEGVQLGQVVGFDGLEPGTDFRAASFAHDGGEGADVPV
jgi:hypothetical protein